MNYGLIKVSGKILTADISHRLMVKLNQKLFRDDLIHHYFLADTCLGSGGCLADVIYGRHGL